MVLRENIPLSLTSYQKCLMQPAIAKQATIETKYDVALFVKQAGLFGGDGGLKKRDFSQQTSCLWRVSLKDFSLFWVFFFYTTLPKAAFASKKWRRRKKRGERCPHAEVLKWRSVVKQNTKGASFSCHCWNVYREEREIKVYLPQILKKICLLLFAQCDRASRPTLRASSGKLLVNQKAVHSHTLMFLQVMSQLCTAVYIMSPHVSRAAFTAAVQLFARDESDHSSSTSMFLVNSQRWSDNGQTGLFLFFHLEHQAIFHARVVLFTCVGG